MSAIVIVHGSGPCPRIWNDVPLADEPVHRTTHRAAAPNHIQWRGRDGKVLPDLWMLSPARGARGGRYNRRAAAMLNAYHPFSDDGSEWEEGNPYRKRQYRRAWEIGKRLSFEVGAKRAPAGERGGGDAAP